MDSEEGLSSLLGSLSSASYGHAARLTFFLSADTRSRHARVVSWIQRKEPTSPQVAYPY